MILALFRKCTLYSNQALHLMLTCCCSCHQGRAVAVHAAISPSLCARAPSPHHSSSRSPRVCWQASQQSSTLATMCAPLSHLAPPYNTHVVVCSRQYTKMMELVDGKLDVEYPLTPIVTNHALCACRLWPHGLRDHQDHPGKCAVNWPHSCFHELTRRLCVAGLRRLPAHRPSYAAFKPIHLLMLTLCVHHVQPRSVVISSPACRDGCRRRKSRL